MREEEGSKKLKSLEEKQKERKKTISSERDTAKEKIMSKKN